MIVLLREGAPESSYTASDVDGVWRAGEVREVADRVGLRLLAEQGHLFVIAPAPSSPEPSPAPPDEDAPKPAKRRKGA